jgi:DNA processing protein
VLGVGRHGPLGPVRLAAGERVGSVDRDPSTAADAATAPRLPAAEEAQAWAVLVTVSALGPVTLARLISVLGSGRQVLELARRQHGAARLSAIPVHRLHGEEPLGDAIAQAIVEAANNEDEIVASIARYGVRVVTVDEPEFPERLRSIELPPPVLFVRGALDALRPKRAVAVVGTRRPSEHGRHVAGRIAAAVAGTGAVVVSGLAVGIDGAAHAAVVALERRTVAVLGGGHGQLYPAAHRRLADAILDFGGAVISELAPWVAPSPGTFPRRNRIISGLADATVVVEAGARSGALSTAAWALEQGRECFLVPGALDAPASLGCLRFLREQAGAARIVAGMPELIEDLGLSVEGRGRARITSETDRARPVGLSALLAELGATEQVVAQALISGAQTLDDLAAATSLPVATLLGAVTLLELRGLAIDALGRYRPAGLLATVTAGARRRRSATFRARGRRAAA